MLECTHEGCGGTSIFSENINCGWTMGMLVPVDPSAPTRGRCPRCKRYKMKVVAIPKPRPVEGPKGFTKIPTK